MDTDPVIEYARANNISEDTQLTNIEIVGSGIPEDYKKMVKTALAKKDNKVGEIWPILKTTSSQFASSGYFTSISEEMSRAGTDMNSMKVTIEPTYRKFWNNMTAQNGLEQHLKYNYAGANLYNINASFTIMPELISKSIGRNSNSYEVNFGRAYFSEKTTESYYPKFFFRGKNSRETDLQSHNETQKGFSVYVPNIGMKFEAGYQTLEGILKRRGIIDNSLCEGFISEKNTKMTDANRNQSVEIPKEEGLYVAVAHKCLLKNNLGFLTWKAQQKLSGSRNTRLTGNLSKRLKTMNEDTNTYYTLSSVTNFGQIFNLLRNEKFPDKELEKKDQMYKYLASNRQIDTMILNNEKKCDGYNLDNFYMNDKVRGFSRIGRNYVFEKIEENPQDQVADDELAKKKLLKEDGPHHCLGHNFFIESSLVLRLKSKLGAKGKIKKNKKFELCSMAHVSALLASDPKIRKATDSASSPVSIKQFVKQNLRVSSGIGLNLLIAGVSFEANWNFLTLGKAGDVVSPVEIKMYKNDS